MNSIIQEISEFDIKNHTEMLELYNKITTDTEITRNGAIFEIMVSKLSKLEKVILAMNIGESKANQQLNSLISTTSDFIQNPELKEKVKQQLLEEQ